MYSPAQQGFGRVRTQGGAKLFGGLSGRSLQREADLASGALAGRSALNAANARAKAIEYQGKMQGRNAMFGGLLSGLGSIAGGFAAGNFGGGGGASSILSNPNIPDMGYDIQFGFKNPMSYSAYSNPGSVFGGFN
tara:strand:- start:251 stop:655 length:405 start_codon:yes stop_codon:yes gene_type:complete